MSSTLLQTTTSTFLDLVGNGRRLSVPQFQRDYAWTQEQWEDLWDDIQTLLEARESVHYLGAIVLETHDDRLARVIDGQQRLVTLTLLAAAVAKALDELVEHGTDQQENRERAERARAIYLGDKDPSSLTYASKISLNKTDDGFFQTYIVQSREPPNPARLPRSNGLIWKAFQFFCKQIGGLPESARTGIRLAELLNEVVARRLVFITIGVRDEVSAYTVFETLNARGLELTASDLLKNHLFSLLRSNHDQNRLAAVWDRIVHVAGQEKLPELLRYYLLLEESRVRSRRLFHELRARVERADQVFEFVHDVEQYAELFIALGDPTHEYWREQPDQRAWIRELKVLGTRQAYPLLFACHRAFEPADFARVLKLVTAISFRYSVIGELNPNPLESRYAQAAKAAKTGAAKTPRSVAKLLTEIYVDDAKFEADFTYATLGTTGASKRLARYVLTKLESEVGKRPVDLDTDPATIEHILPENPDADWIAAFGNDALEGWTYRIGNLGLLEASFNREAGRASFAEKRLLYARSAYALVKDVVGDQWNAEAIEARQRALARVASRVWRSDFA